MYKKDRANFWPGRMLLPGLLPPVVNDYREFKEGEEVSQPPLMHLTMSLSLVEVYFQLASLQFIFLTNGSIYRSRWIRCCY